jgi:hypothetical protein
MEKNIVVLVRQEGLGLVDPEDRKFGIEMLDKFLHSLEGQPVKPRTICFYTSGVKAVAKGSPVVPGLSLLEGMGVRLIVCKTCLEKYGLIEKVAVGQVGGMNEIAKILLEADSVIAV